MKIFYLGLFIIWAAALPLFKGDLCAHSGYAKKITGFYDSLLTDQDAVEKINAGRPAIYLYTDFGGGQNQEALCSDGQTAGEIASAGWKGSLQKSLFINDSARPLDPKEAAYRLAKAFPYNSLLPFHSEEKSKFHTIVVHVIDPGVGNSQEGAKGHPRALVLRKDGVLFIGPDNGTLSFACPEGSISAAHEIDADAITELSGIDVKAGGTFHGRDLFCEAAFRLAAGQVSFEEIASLYPSPNLRTRLEQDAGRLEGAPGLLFEQVRLDRFEAASTCEAEDALFGEAFFLGVIQSPLYSEEGDALLTKAKKLFIIRNISLKEELIGIINQKTGNVYLGPNKGLATAFIAGWSKEDFEVYSVSSEEFTRLIAEENNEAAALRLRQNPAFDGELAILPFLGAEEDSVRDEKGRLHKVEVRIWIDQYGNIKTTLPSTFLKEVQAKGGRGRIAINGIERPLLFANSFSEVPEGRLFAYSGSSAKIGPNPHRSIRYVEVTANGVYGKFGADFFERKGFIPRSGQKAYFLFDYD